MALVKDDAALWFETQGRDIQDYEVPEDPMAGTSSPMGDEESTFSSPEEDGSTLISADAVEQRANLMEYNKPISETIVFLMDLIIPTLLLLTLKGSRKEDLKLDEGEQAQLVNAWALYLGDKEVQVSPGMALLICILTVYGSKVAVALAHRKEDEEKRRLQATVAAQQGEMQRLADEVERLKRGKEAGDAGGV